MAAEDDGPNFSYAFGDATPTVPSWNPALRPDHESPVKTSFGKTPFSQPSQREVEDEEEDDELPLPVQESATVQTWEPEAHVRDEIPQSDDDFFDRYGRPEVEPTPAVSAPVASAAAELVEEAGASEEVDAWAADGEEGADAPWGQQDEEGATELNGSRQEDVDVIAAKHPMQPEPESHEEEERGQQAEQAYEHQGETDVLEDALQEDAAAPLISPAKETSTEEWGVSEDWQAGAGEHDAPLPVEAQISDDAFAFEAGDDTFEQLAAQEPQQPDVSAAVFSTDETTLASRDTHLAHDTAVSAPEPTTAPEPEAAPVRPSTEDEQQAVPQAAQSSTQDEWGASTDDAFHFGAGDAANDILSASVPTEVNAPPAEDLADAWAAAMGDDEFLADPDAAAAFGFDDGEGFLEEFPSEPVAAAGAVGAVGAAAVVNRHKRSASTTKYTPANVPQAGLPPPSRTASYTPTAPNFVDLSKAQQQPIAAQRGSVASPYASAYQQPVQQERPPIQSAESFADKAKGGYHSPYDLPDDLAIKRRRPAAHPQASAPVVQQAVPPPRLSSMQSMPSMSAPPPNKSPLAPGFPGAHQVPPQAASQPAKPPSRAGGFFEDLPIAPRPPRTATPSRSYSPAPAQAAPPPPALAPPAQIRPASTSYAPQQPPAQQQVDPAGLPQLRPAERMPLYDDAPQPPQQQGSTTMPPPPPSGRYSPAAPSAVPAARSAYSPAPPPAGVPQQNASRYSPAPGAGAGAKPPPNVILRQPSEGVSRAQAQSYAPRTSSPLAYRDPPAQTQPPPTSSPPSQQHADIPPPAKANLNRMGSIASMAGLETVNENAEPMFSPPSRPDGPRQAPPTSSRGSTPPPSRSQPSSGVNSPRKRANYAPANYQPVAAPSEGGIVPPRRSQTSSPSAAMKVPHLPIANLDRPASVAGLQSPTKTTFAAVPRQQNRIISSSMGNPLYHEMNNLVQPQDASVQDPLQRWKGAPVFSWGNGNAVVTTFPKYTPMYGSGAAGPVVRPVPGEIKQSVLATVCPQSEIFLKFPGPLKKGKKKEVLAWLKSSADQLEVEHKNASMNGELTTAMHTRSEERILLWRVLALLIEHDGTLEGSPAVDAAVRALLTPSTPDPVSATEDASPTRTTQPEALDPLSVKVLRTHLYAGEREKAVWHAVDQRLWAHALLIASTLNDKEIWKQVVQEFVRKEVRKVGENTEALAALYQVFAGNWEESIDELVSVSARSGFKMVSTAASGRAGEKDALAGLDRWRETLLLVLNNRSVGDAAALASLGNLLNGFGRTEAGHICFLFARANARFGGADNPESHFTLLGGHASQQGADFGSSLDTILLSEVYEFALSLAPSTTAPVTHVPHLQAYKLHHASVLAESGERTKAQQYCDAITSIVTAKANRNPYYSAQLLRALDEFAKRLSQQASAGSGGRDASWKPSMDKVSSSVWSKFNNFIAGEADADAVEGPGAVPANTEQGFTPMPMPPTPPTPQQGVGMPPMGRTVSSSDVYGAYGQTNGAPISSPPPNSGVGGRYAPGAAYTPRSSSEAARPKYASHSQSAYEPRSSNEYGSPSFGAGAGGQYTPTTASYNPEGLGLQGGGGSPYVPSAIGLQQGSVESPGYLPTPPLEQGPTAVNGYSPANAEFDAQPAQSYGYEPTASSYEPAPYQPYQPDESAPPAADAEEPQPKKKSFMDDDEDDDLAARAAALKINDGGKGAKGKSDADRIAEEAFRKAAEADAAKDASKAPPGARGSWFGGWFKAKQPDPNMPTVHKAKLGEESSFVFDKELGRWVNKKAGAEASAPVAATPPPPKMAGPPISRPGSAMPPPPGLGSGAGTPALSSSPASVGPPPGSSGSMGPPQRSASAQPPLAGPVAALAGGPPSRPPSRPSTSMSGASDIDDLLGPATGGTRKPGAKKGGRKGRYVDVMAQK